MYKAIKIYTTTSLNLELLINLISYSRVLYLSIIVLWHWNDTYWSVLYIDFFKNERRMLTKFFKVIPKNGIISPTSSLLKLLIFMCLLFEYYSICLQ